MDNIPVDPVSVASSVLTPSLQARREDHPATVFDLLFGHCRDDSIIATGVRRLSKQSPAEPHPAFLRPIRVNLLQSFFPFYMQQLSELTKYIAHNTFEQACLLGKPIDRFYQNNSQTDPSKLEYFQVARKYLRELGALTLDIDVGRPGLPDADETFGKVIGMAHRNEIPLPTMTAYSGRGIYLVWKIVDHRGVAPINTQANFQLYRECAIELIRLLQPFYPDSSKSGQPVSWFKGPGATDHATGNRVIYAALFDSLTGKSPAYQLPELKRSLGITSSEPWVRLPEPPSTPARKKRRKVNYKRAIPSWSRTHLNICNEIETVSRARGGIKEGCRELMLFYYYARARAGWTAAARFKARARYGHHLPAAVKARATRIAWTLAHKKTIRLNAKFNPPLPSVEIEKIFQHADSGAAFVFKDRSRVPKRGFASGEKIAAGLGLGLAEATQLDLQHVVPPEIKDSREHFAKAEDQARKAAKKKRRDAVDLAIHAGLKNRQIIAELGPEIEVKQSYISMRRERLRRRKKDLERTGKLFE